jgi:hypothetical protein
MTEYTPLFKYPICLRSAQDVGILPMDLGSPLTDEEIIIESEFWALEENGFCTSEIFLQLFKR